MAKADNEKLYQDFLADLKKINPKIEEVLDEPTSAKLKESVLARSEMSRQMDAIATERKQMEDFLAQEKAKIDGWQKWYGDTTKEVATISDELKTYRETYGALDSTSKRQLAEQHGMTKEELDKKLQERDLGALRFVDALTDLKIEHRDRFKEKLNTDDVYKIAGEKNLPLDVAYNLYIGDRVKEQQKVELEARIKQERQDAIAEFATKHNLPGISSTPDFIHPVDVKQPLTDPNARISAAVADFSKRNAGR